MASKITYDNKISLTTSALPKANKCTDDDLNEIKQVVNDNADELDENTTNIEGLQGTILFENEDGVNTNIVLSESAVNFNYIEIFFARKGSLTIFSSVKVENPDGKYVQLSFNHSSGDVTMQIYGSRLYINGTTINREQNTMFQMNNTGFVSMSTPTDLNIYKVVGYK